MPLEIAYREQQGVPILRLRGQMVFGDGDQQLGKEVRYVVSAREPCLVIDLAGVDKIDSAGWASLLSASAELGKRGGRLALANLDRSHLKAALKITQLETVLNIFGSEQDAVNSFFPGGKAPDRDFEEETSPMPTGVVRFRD